MPPKTIQGHLFGHMCSPFAANMTYFCDLALGTCQCVAQGVIHMVLCLNSGAMLVTFGTYANQFIPKLLTDTRTHESTSGVGGCAAFL